MRYVYVQGGQVISDAHEPYLQIFSVMEAPNDVANEDLIEVDGKLVKLPQVEPEPTLNPEVPIEAQLPQSADIINRAKLRLLGKPVMDVDVKLLSLIAVVIGLYNAKDENLLMYSISQLKEYLDATEPD